MTTTPRTPTPTSLPGEHQCLGHGSRQGVAEGQQGGRDGPVDLETRPSMLFTTRRCFSVAQTTVPAASAPFTTRAAVARPHELVARP